MEKKPLILIGGGGHCKSCIDVIECEGVFTIKGILDTKEKIGKSVLGYPIIGSDDDILEWVEKGHSFLITVGQIKTSHIRKKIYQKLKDFNAMLAKVVAPTATLSKHAAIGEGSIVMHNATINADAIIGVNCIINTASNIEHDVTVGDHCHISTHAVINGNCTLGNEVFIGSGSILSNGICVVDKVVFGAGSLVYKSVNETGTYAGNPLRKI